MQKNRNPWRCCISFPTFYRRLGADLNPKGIDERVNAHRDTGDRESVLGTPGRRERARLPSRMPAERPSQRENELIPLSSYGFYFFLFLLISSAFSLTPDVRRPAFFLLRFRLFTSLCSFNGAFSSYAACVDYPSFDDCRFLLKLGSQKQQVKILRKEQFFPGE